LGKVGEGFKVAVGILNNGRFGLGAAAGGAIRELIGVASEYATSRTQFGRPISEFALIKDKFAHFALDAYACESMAYMTTGMIDRGDPDCYVEAAICKVFGSEASFRAIDEGIQVMGGMGFMTHWPFERQFRDSRILTIFEGTNEILRMLIALSGIRAVGDRLQKVAKNLTSLSVLFQELKERFTFWSDFDVKGIHPKIATEGKMLRLLTKQFGRVVASLIMRYKKDLIEQQQHLKRVADVTIDLYAMTAVLSRASRALESNSPTAEHEFKLAKAFSRSTVHRIRDNFVQIRSSSSSDTLLRSIADDMFKENKYIPPHPIGI